MTKSYLDKIETNVTKSVFKIFQRAETKHNLLQGLGEAIDRQTYPKFWKGWFWIEPTLHQLGSRALSISTGSNLYYVTKTMKVKQKIIYIHTYIHIYIY